MFTFIYTKIEKGFEYIKEKLTELTPEEQEYHNYIHLSV